VAALRFKSICFFVSFSFMSLLVVSPALTESRVVPTPAVESASNLQTLVEGLSTPSGRVVASNHILAVNFLQKFYAANGYQPVWTNPINIKDLKKAITDSWMDGLQREDFHAEALGLVFSSSSQLPKLSDYEQDILLSDALVRILYQMFYGKVSPAKIDADWNYERTLPDGEPVHIINQALEFNNIRGLIDGLRIKHPYYTGLQKVLKIYTFNALLVDWPVIKDGLVLNPGDTSDQVPILRRRMALADGVEASFISQSEIYDDDLAGLVRKFQINHGIVSDGVVGPGTIKELNVPPEKRVDQVRVNMERARWVLRTIEAQKDQVIVNVAGFYLLVILNDKQVWKTQVITGKPYHKTPVFIDEMEYVVLNPTWGVPRSIVRNEIFGKAKANPAYLTQRNYELVGANGVRVSPTSLDWNGLSARSFPYNVVQKPGPKNALGRVKFIFPNHHNVYLHDTPSRSLFGKTGRAFSHGCIRVKDPIKLAEIILSNRNGYTRDQIDKILATGKLRQVNLSKTLPVAILYWTVDPSIKGQVRFYKDIYGRDERLLKALNAKFVLP